MSTVNDFGFNPDEKASVLVDENCLGKSLDDPWKAAIEGLMELDKAGHNIIIFTSDEGRLKKFLANNFTKKEVIETREKKMVEVEELKDVEVDGVLQKIPVKVMVPEFPKVKKELERVAIFPRIITLIADDPSRLWFTRYGQISSMISTLNYKMFIVESTDDVICKLKGVDSISKVTDFRFQSSLGNVGKIVQVKAAADWKDVIEAIKPEPVSKDGSLKAPPEAYKASKGK